MKIQIFGQNELVKHIEKGEKIHSHCISIINPGKPVHENDPSHISPDILIDSFKEVLILDFWDANKVEHIDHFESKKIPSEVDITKILSFVERTKDEATGYTIHCWRGISRSTAVGFGILQYFLNDEKEAADRLIKVRRNTMPLKLIVQLFDKALGSNLAAFNETVYKAGIEAMRRDLNL